MVAVAATVVMEIRVAPVAGVAGVAMEIRVAGAVMSAPEFCHDTCVRGGNGDECFALHWHR